MKINKTITEDTDDQIIQNFLKTKDMSLIDQLYRRYVALSYGVCLKYLENTELAKDAVMDIFETLPDKLFRYQIDCFRTWLYSVVRNHCLQQIRRNKNIQMVNIDEHFVETDSWEHLIDKHSNDEEIKALEYCMTTLSTEQSSSVKYFFFENYSYAEIVELTGFDLSKVKSYIQNGKRNLKNCINRIVNK